MIRKQFLLFSSLTVFAAILVGCGSNVKEGVADGPDDPEVELTEEEVEGEEEATQNYGR